MSRRGRVVALVLALAVVIAIPVYAVASKDEATFEPPVVNATPAAAPGARLIPDGELLVRGVDERASRADGALYEIASSGKPTAAGSLSCKRVTRVVRGRGLCMRVAPDGSSYEGVTFDGRYRPLRRFPIEGIPDRARPSRDGRYVAYTSFDPAGAEGYFETPTDFSTWTRIIESGTGKVLLKLEDLEVTENGRPIKDKEAELWGVTFADGDAYYATLAANGEHYLIRGRVGSERARVVRDHVECPALSPDGTRIAYKRRIGDTNKWRYHVFELASGEDVALAETRSVDDQPEWLGDDLIAYSDDESVLAVPADGSGRPSVIARRATSPQFMAAR
jgi:hypothetical protein